MCNETLLILNNIKEEIEVIIEDYNKHVDSYYLKCDIDSFFSEINIKLDKINEKVIDINILEKLNEIKSKINNDEIIDDYGNYDLNDLDNLFYNLYFKINEIYKLIDL